MARKQTRVLLNQSKLDQAQLALAMGILNLGHDIALEASSRAADAPPYGEGIVKGWGVAVYVGTKKVGDISADGTATAKPRAFKVRGREGLSAVVGFGFPARFLEMGTSDTAAQPFLTPAVMSVGPKAAELIREGAAPILSRP